MPAYVIVEIDVLDPARYEDYKRLASPAIAAHGGKYLVRGGRVDVLEGPWPAKRVVILEFASMDAARKWWESPEYSEARRVRKECATATMIAVEGMSV